MPPEKQKSAPARLQTADRDIVPNDDGDLYAEVWRERGNVPITNRRFFAIALPAILANVTTPLLGVVATAIIGNLGEVQLLAGTAMASVVFDWLFWLFGFLRMSTLGFAAQAYGAGSTGEVNAILVRSLLFAVAIGAALVLLQSPLAAVIFGVMGGDGPTVGTAEDYFFSRIWGAPFALANCAIQGWLIGQARVQMAVVLQVGINLANVILIVVLVTIFHLGVSGAAWAAVVAEGIGCVLALVLARASLVQSVCKIAAVFERDKFLALAVVNRDIMIRTALLISAFFFFTSQSARAGGVTLAANAVLNNFIMVGSFFLDGLANGAEQLCGQSLGAREREHFTKAARIALKWSLIFGAILTVGFWTFGEPLIDAMVSNSDVRVAAREYLWFAALGPLCAAATYCFDGIYVGAAWAREMRNMMILAFVTYGVAWYFLAPLGNVGLWLALLCFLLSRGIFQAAQISVLVQRSFGPRYAEAP